MDGCNTTEKCEPRHHRDDRVGSDWFIEFITWCNACAPPLTKFQNSIVTSRLWGGKYRCSVAGKKNTNILGDDTTFDYKKRKFRKTRKCTSDSSLSPSAYRTSLALRPHIMLECLINYVHKEGGVLKKDEKKYVAFYAHATCALHK